ncbi:MAG: SpoIIE family protein phosphatase, partial [Oscillospiraceae bacterium]
AYSTFSLIQIDRNNDCYLAQYDNPTAIILRSGKPIFLKTTQRTISDKEVSESSFRMRSGDILIFLSDGVTSAGMDGIIPTVF